MSLRQGEYIKEGIQPGSWAVFYDASKPHKFIIDRYYRSEVRTPMDIHWTLSGEYYTECRVITDLHHLLILDNN